MIKSFCGIIWRKKRWGKPRLDRNFLEFFRTLESEKFYKIMIRDIDKTEGERK